MEQGFKTPGIKTISDLFSVVGAVDGNVVPNETTRKRVGKTPDESSELGRQSLREGNFRAAVQHFKAAIAQRQQNGGDLADIASLIDLAGAYEFGDEYPQAMRQYESALRLRGDIAEPHVGMSDLYRRYGRFRDSIERLEQAVRLEPANSYLRIKLAEALRDAGQPKRALSSAQQAVVAKPDEAFYHYWIGDLLIAMKRYDEALDSLRAAIELSPGDDYLYLRASVAFWKADRRAESVKAVRLASDLDPSKHLYHGLLGILLQETGQEEEAALESGRAGKMDRYDHDTLSRLLEEMDIEP